MWWFTAHPAYHMRRGDLAGLISSLTLPAKYLEVVSRAQRPRFVPEIPCPQCGWPLNWHTLQRGKAHCARAEQSHDVGFGSKLKWQTTPSPFFDASMVAEALSYVRRVKDSSQQQEMFPE